MQNDSGEPCPVCGGERVLSCEECEEQCDGDGSCPICPNCNGTGQANEDEGMEGVQKSYPEN